MTPKSEFVLYRLISGKAPSSRSQNPISIVDNKLIFGVGSGGSQSLEEAPTASNTALIQIDMDSTLIPKDSEEHEIAGYVNTTSSTRASLGRS